MGGCQINQNLTRVNAPNCDAYNTWTSKGAVWMAPPMRTLAFLSVRDWHFRLPVCIGDTIRMRSKVVEKEIRANGRRGVLTWQRQIVNQEGKVVQEGTTVTLVECRLPKREGAPTV